MQNIALWLALGVFPFSLKTSLTTEADLLLLVGVRHHQNCCVHYINVSWQFLLTIPLLFSSPAATFFLMNQSDLSSTMLHLRFLPFQYLSLRVPTYYPKIPVVLPFPPWFPLLYMFNLFFHDSLIEAKKWAVATSFIPGINFLSVP